MSAILQVHLVCWFFCDYSIYDGNHISLELPDNDAVISEDEINSSVENIHKV